MKYDTYPAWYVIDLELKCTGEVCVRCCFSQQLPYRGYQRKRKDVDDDDENAVIIGAKSPRLELAVDTTLGALVRLWHVSTSTDSPCAFDSLSTFIVHVLQMNQLDATTKNEEDLTRLYNNVNRDSDEWSILEQVVDIPSNSLDKLNHCVESMGLRSRVEKAGTV